MGVTRWQVRTLFIVSLGVVAVGIASAIQGRWLLLGWALLSALVLAGLFRMLPALRRELGVKRKELAKALRRNEKLARSLVKAEAQISPQPKVAEDEPWRAAVPLPTLSRKAEQLGYLAVVAMVKNEGSYLREWLAFHRLVGVQHVFLYDNGSSDETLSGFSRLLTSQLCHLNPMVDIRPRRQRATISLRACLIEFWARLALDGLN